MRVLSLFCDEIQCISKVLSLFMSRYSSIECERIIRMSSLFRERKNSCQRSQNTTRRTELSELMLSDCKNSHKDSTNDEKISRHTRSEQARNKQETKLVNKVHEDRRVLDDENSRLSTTELR
jgi:hypothetical protein